MICGVHVGIEASGDGGRHVVGLADVRAPAANEGATSRDRRRPCEVCGLAGFEGAELRHCDQQSKGGDLRDARDAGQDYEATGKDGVSLDDEEDRGFDRLDLSFDLIETLCVPAFQERKH